MAKGPFDLVVIGSGPGGYVGAIRAAQLGLKVVLVEKDSKFGGTCLHVGCIPTKALLHDAYLFARMRDAARFGISASGVQLDFAAVRKHKEKVVAKLSAGVEGLLRKNKITIFNGFGKIAGPGRVTVGEEEVEARSIMVATGSEARTFPGMEPDGKGILTNREILALTDVPKSLVVIGAGAVGCEFASIFNHFGCKVTLVEMLPQLVPFEDAEVGAELEKIFKRRGIDVHTGSKVEGIGRAKGKYDVLVAGPKGSVKVTAEKVLVAVGRRPNTEGIGLEKAKTKVEKGLVQVGPYMETDEPGVYAVGDIVPSPQLAHVASAEATLVAEKLGGREVKPINYDRVPSVTYCDPQVASVGLTEAKAKERGHDVKVGRFPFLGVGMASVEMENDGFVKIVADAKYGEILGVHIIHAHAANLVGEATAVLAGELTAEDLAHTVHAHPTLSEGILEAAHAIFGQPVHL